MSATEAEFVLPPGCDASATWQYDPMHFPRPKPPLAQDIHHALMEHAFGVQCVSVHGFPFAKNLAPPQPTPEVLEKGAVRIWQEEFVPRIEAFCARVRGADYESMSAAALASELPGLFKEAGETHRYTMIVVYPFMGPTLALVEFANQVLGPSGPLLVASMLQGYANESSAAGTGLDDLTNIARALPEVAKALQDGRFDELSSVPGGHEFKQALGRYLDAYGWRVDDWSLVHAPTWAEDPTTPLRLIASFLRGDTGSPGASMRRAVEVREAAEREVRSRLEGAQLGQLMGMLEVAKPHVSMSEGRARWQLTIVGSLRAPILALGQKLQASGALETPNDAFYLDLAELQAVAAAPSAETKALVKQRKHELKFQHTLLPPPFLGAPPDLAALPPEARLVRQRFFGVGVEASKDAAIINGNAASPGLVRGRARVIRELSEADRLEPGDILVCTMTAPPWSPLFAIASAVVTDTGGVLSHSAICAREFAIPCVAGTQIGTKVIQDGSFITVDGDQGIVRLEN